MRRSFLMAMSSSTPALASLAAAAPSTNSPWPEISSLQFLPLQPPEPLESWDARLLLLPTGQIMWMPADGSTRDTELYTSPGTVNPAWAPTISSVPTPLVRGNSYTISGTQFNGLTAGTTYGDDGQMATSYPIVRIANVATKHVFYARTHDHSTMGIATGSTTVSTHL